MGQVHGGDGDDTWIIQDYATVDAASGTDGPNDSNANDYGFGGAGDDLVRGTHKVTGYGVHYGGDGSDKVYGGDATDFNLLVGNAGDDWIEGGDFTGDQYIYGDNVSDVTDFDYGGDYAGEFDFLRDVGDDFIYGGDSGTGVQELTGGYGDDKLIGGSNIAGITMIYGDHREGNIEIPDDEWDKFTGAMNDGDDLIDFGDSPDAAVVAKGFGQGGNDKVIGGLRTGVQFLYGGDGDDKIWAINPG